MQLGSSLFAHTGNSHDLGLLKSAVWSLPCSSEVRVPFGFSNINVNVILFADSSMLSPVLAYHLASTWISVHLLVWGEVKQRYIHSVRG